jgi:hypothetical protein
MTQVFLSYASGDEEFVSELRQALTARGADVFDALKDVQPGADISASILGRLKRSDLVVFVVPRHEGQGKSALFELGAAKVFGKRIASVLPDRVRAANNDVASVLGNSFFLDAAGKNVGALADQVLSDLAAA